ncbi:DUF192 domain-containing protein [Pseudaminobacter soli (ex Li et al. 2025)]|uniref:DUF192 domain-containing protein n=1 Tax=Pseudaminobacter soli (ex Li et al. 2025) TaxID=1295366 RepID=A0A2P7SNM2_9HYPH|nr:DUF192 domain-containing protein [Mesorhizobium soli]PSJ64058.1 hypothetical protein C7I85_02820 [Mesorhizobium soli]
MTRRIWCAAGAIFAAVLGAFLYLAQPESSIADGLPMLLANDPAPLVAVTAKGEHSFSIEIADNDKERAAGLMFREKMADDHGMLFVFDRTQPVGFWMKNTPMALDLVFIGPDGTVKAVRRGEPFSEALIAPADAVRFVLELKAGMAEKAGIKNGDILRHPIISAASSGN